MLRLLLLRHAKSDWNDPSLADHDRPLAPRGLEATRRLSRWVEEHHVKPDLVLCSSATRVRQTLDNVRSALGSPPALFEDGLYHASADWLLSRIGAVDDDVATLLVVGHNPGLEELCSVLAGVSVTMPTGAVATLTGEIAGWTALAPGRLTLESLVLPRELGRGQGTR